MIRIITDNLLYMGIAAAVFSLLLLLITWVSRRRLSSRLYLAGWITALVMLVIPAYAVASMAGFSFFGIFGNSDANSQVAQYREAYTEYMEKSIFPARADTTAGDTEEMLDQNAVPVGSAAAAGQLNNADASSPAGNGTANIEGISAGTKSTRTVDKVTNKDTDTGAITADSSAHTANTISAMSLSLREVVFAVWTFGVIVIGALKFFRYFRFRKMILRNSIPGDEIWMALLRENVRGNLNVREANVPSPVVFGIFHPTVVIPKRELSDASMRYALMHEGLHILRKDLLLRTAAEAAAVLNWINPFAWLIRNKVTQYSENTCDEEVVVDLPSEERQKYAMSILDFMDTSEEPKPAFPATLMSFSGEAKHVKRRLKHIMEFKTMRKRAVILSCCVLISAALIGILASCSLAFPGGVDKTDTSGVKPGNESSETVATSVSPTDSSETSETSVPAETTMLDPSEFQAPEGASFIRGYSSYGLITMESMYLLSEQEVTVIDEHVADGITPATGGEKVVLPAGTVAVPLKSANEITENEYYEFSPTLTNDSVLILMDGRCVTFNVTKESDGSLLFNGLKQEELLGMRVYPEYPAAKTEKAEGELRASEVQDPTISYKVLTLKTDWNGDGVNDTFRRERLDGNDTADGVLTFTDGATGKTTDITKYCAEDDSGFLFVLTDNAYFYEDEDGNRVILDAFDVCSSDYMTFAYTYDPTTIIAYKEVGGSLKVENDEPCLIRNSFIFGNCASVILPASIKDNTLVAQELGTEIWWVDNREAGTDLSILPAEYTCTFKDFAAEKITGDVVGPVTIPAGVAIFPLYTVTDESGAGTFYFRTVADGVCQANFTNTADAYNTMFGGINQNNLFWCGWGD